MSRAYFFGCWNQLGHYWFKPDGSTVDAAEERTILFAGNTNTGWLDGCWAPRRFKDDCFMRRGLVNEPMICFVIEGRTRDERSAIGYDTDEHPQGLFAIHYLWEANQVTREREGKCETMISWWDRTQGDRRSASNSNFVLGGEHTAEVMLTALREHFPHIVENLSRAGVDLKLLPPEVGK